MSELPALLLTDVVDSTKLSEELGDKTMAGVWAAHDRIARDLLPVWRGREIDKTDGMLLLFESAGDAAHYAVAYHRSLAALPVPLKARAGLHVGPLTLRENSREDIARGAKPLEVEGLAKPTAARVMSLAQGGQTLLTAKARDAVGATGLRIQSHGHWCLKGIAEPVELFEAGDAEASFIPPPDNAKAWRVVRSGDLWLPVRQIANNLPQQVTSFVGRKRELAEVLQSLSSTRLLTLLGIGGLGKTRLALLVATALLGDFVDGVWFVELAPLSDGQQVPQAVASALQVKEEPGLTVFEALLKQVKGRRQLIVLDNCEHLLDACAALARQLLEGAPDLKLLATSREPLRVAGETGYPLPALQVPSVDTAATVESLAQNEAVRLFVDRAKAVRPGFVVDAQVAPAVADSCRRLDGIPLALELAAARVRALPVQAIAERLNDRFRLLTRGDRTALPRQQTLRALIDWSHDLLTLPERALLRRLAVFAGGWTLQAAEAVGAGGDVADGDGDVLDLLSHLVDKSLVATEAGGRRYRLLETVRAYALERLDASAEGEATRARHLGFVLALAERASAELWGADQGEWVSRLDLERENFFAALGWCGYSGETAAQGLRLVGKLQLYWMPSGQLELGYRLTLQALARSAIAAPTEDRCSALYAASQLAYFLGRFEDVQTYGERSEAAARAIGSPARAADALLMLGYAADELERHDVALPHFEASIALARQLGDRARLSYALNALAGHYSESDPNRALPLFEEALVLVREAGDRDSVAVTLQNIARALVTLGRREGARELLLESLDIGTQIGSRRVLMLVLDVCVALAAQRAAWQRSARFLGAADAQLEQLGLHRVPGDEAFIALGVAQASAAMDTAEFAAARAEARRLDPEQAMAEARAWLASDA